MLAIRRPRKGKMAAVALERGPVDGMDLVDWMDEPEGC